MIRRPWIGRIFLCAGVFCMLGVGTTVAEGIDAETAPGAPKPFPSFEARRVVAPKPGTPPKITIQITSPEPSEDVSSAADTGEGAVAATTGQGRYDWFWQKVSPALQQEGLTSRLDLAMTALSAAQAPVPAPGLQLMQQIIDERASNILIASAGTNVSPALILAVIAVESGGKSDATSAAGAQGLMQLMPDTATRFGVTDALEPAQNIRGGILYLDWLMGEFEGDVVLALAGYNAGEGAVRAHQGVPPFAETRDYVPKVLAAYQVARALCLTPPVLISDGCVFRQIK